MQSIQLVNRILLGAIAFCVSFGIGLFNNPNQALLNASITVLSSYIGVMVADKRRITQEKQLKTSLLHQIQEFQEEQDYLYQSLSQSWATKQQLDASIKALQAERNQLLYRISELHNQRNELYHELLNVEQHKQHELAEFYHLKSQIEQLEKHQNELNQSLWAKTAQIQPAETRLTHLHSELEELQNEISDQLNQQEQLQQDLATLERRKQDLGGEAYDLYTQIQALKQRWDELNESLLYLRIQQQRVQSSLTSLQTELEQMQTQVAVKQQQEQQLNRDLVTLEQLKQQLETDYRYLQNQMQILQSQKNTSSEVLVQTNDQTIGNILPGEWIEWLEFNQKLTEYEQVALKAILDRDQATYKEMVDHQKIIPQILISSINARALETFNYILLVSNNATIIPEVNESYLSILVDSATIYFKELLELNEINLSQLHSVSGNREQGTGNR